MKGYDIADMGGDGTGPEVVRESRNVLNAVASKCSLTLDFIGQGVINPRYAYS